MRTGYSGLSLVKTEKCLCVYVCVHGFVSCDNHLLTTASGLSFNTVSLKCGLLAASKGFYQDSSTARGGSMFKFMHVVYLEAKGIVLLLTSSLMQYIPHLSISHPLPTFKEII